MDQDRLTPEQIVARLETAFEPHTTKAEVFDYGDKIRFKVWAVNDGPVLASLENVPVRNMRSESDLEDIIAGTWQHITDELFR